MAKMLTDKGLEALGKAQIAVELLADDISKIVPQALVDPPVPPPLDRPPYFDIGDAHGAPGEFVTLSVEAGCRYPMVGCHIGGGLAGYGKFEAVGVTLGPFLTAYLKAEDMIHDKPMHQHQHYWSMFQMVSHAKGALPTEWWDFGLGFFSLDQERRVPATTIPSGTELFTLRVKIFRSTKPGVYTLSCLDEAYYRQNRHRRLDFLFMAGRDSDFARGGITKLDLTGGTITVT